MMVRQAHHERNQLCRVGNAFLPTIAPLKGGQTIKPFAHPARIIWQIVFILLLTIGLQTPASAMMEHDHMLMDEKGMIMNANTDRLPKDCQKVSGDVDITIRAGHQYAKKFNGKMYAFDNQEWNVPPCTRINITFINDDEIRHQLMIHGLPGYIYPQGMFHLELYGAGELKASLIMPAQKKTYLVHCELPQHMEKGMKAQLKVDGGDGDLPSIPGLTKPVRADSYPVDWTPAMGAMLLACVLVGCVVPLFLLRKLGRLG
ncbi:hypothetical protein MGMO_141c00130 [Methyloglobulus morosus KoM1]|uniref:Multicopper oxidase type 2 n=1 Tax=Methyloglobulus morosus KoM1 TaxID=1116472 RepID=V5B6Q0_9GAMM|nr:hypothetical protein [Methyloglobulus morosus]ESS68930.1 hypothetical protein MGMO_141c00130 [Methyloglobulus morosus KoM1]